MIKTLNKHRFVYGIVVDNLVYSSYYNNKFVFGDVVDYANKLVFEPECEYTLNFVGLLVFNLYTKDKDFIRVKDITQYDVDSIAGLNSLPDKDLYKLKCYISDLDSYFKGDRALVKTNIDSKFFDLPTNPILYYSEYLDDVSEYTRSSDYDYIFKPINISSFSRDKLINSIVIFGTNNTPEYNSSDINDAFIYNPIKNKFKRYIKKTVSDGSVYFINLDTHKVIAENKFIDKYVCNKNPLKCKVYKDYYIKTNACDTSNCSDYLRFGNKYVITLNGGCNNGMLSLPLDCKVVENLNPNTFSKCKGTILSLVLPPKIEEIRLENLRYNDIIYISDKTKLDVVRDFVKFTLRKVELEQYKDKISSDNMSDILSTLPKNINAVIY